MIPEDPSTYPDDENTTQPAASNRNTPDPTIEPILDDQQSHSASVINSSPHPPAADPIEWTSDELDFDQLIEVGNTRLFEQHLPSLATIWGVENEELLDDYVAKEHECVFQLSGASLHTLINILECTVPPLRGQRGTVRLTLETKRLSGRSYYNEAFCDAYVDLVKPAHLVDGHAKLVFVVAFDDLCAMSKGIGRQARLTYSTKEHQLIVSSERFERPLQIEPERLFIDHSGVSPGFTENRSPVRLPSSFLLACLTYVSSQTPTNTFDSPINVTQVRNGLAISGTSTATAIARYTGFEETNITVHNKNLRQLLQYLRQIAGQEVRSRLLDNHHLIDANCSTLGFTRTWKLPEKAETPETSDSQRSEQQFPPVESLLVFEDYK